MKLKSIFLCGLLSIQVQSAGTEVPYDAFASPTNTNSECSEMCKRDIANIYKQFHERIYYPESFQIYHLTRDKDYEIPITKGIQKLYSTTKKGVLQLHSKNNKQFARLFLGFSILLDVNDPDIELFGLNEDVLKEMDLKYVYISPILDRTYNYVSGFVVAGYSHSVASDYRLNSNFEVLNLRLSTILEKCL